MEFRFELTRDNMRALKGLLLTKELGKITKKIIYFVIDKRLLFLIKNFKKYCLANVVLRT